MYHIFMFLILEFKKVKINTSFDINKTAWQKLLAIHLNVKKPLLGKSGYTYISTFPSSSSYFFWHISPDLFSLVLLWPPSFVFIQHTHTQNRMRKKEQEQEHTADECAFSLSLSFYHTSLEAERGRKPKEVVPKNEEGRRRRIGKHEKKRKKYISVWNRC